MGAPLNVKNEDAYRRASRLSELAGESLSSVVTKALQVELGRAEHERDVQARIDEVMAMAQEIRAHLREPVSPGTGWIRDEAGVPK